MRTFAIGVSTVSIFLAGGLAVASGATRQVDRAFTLWLQSFASERLDTLADLNTLVGQSTVDAAIALLLAVALFRIAPGPAWAVPLVFLALLTALELGGKIALSHPGPPEEFIRTSFNPLGVHVRLPSSYPSGHVARTTYLALLVSGIFPARALRALLLALVLATPFARVYLGDHWLSDVVGGLAIGVLCGVLALEALARLRRRPGTHRN